MTDLDDRFGCRKARFVWLGNPMMPTTQLLGVPTRREVAESPAKDLCEKLIDWTWELPSELIPSNERIAEMKSLLLAWPDARASPIMKLIGECDAYLSV